MRALRRGLVPGLALLLAAAPAAAESPAGVTRLPSDAVAELARAWVLERFGAELDGGTIQLIAPPRDLVLPAGDLSTRLSLQAGAPTAGHLTVLVEAATVDVRGIPTARSTTVAFRVDATQEVLVAVRELPRGAVLAAGDLRRERRPGERLPRHALVDPAEAVGKEVLRPVAPGEILTAAAVAAPRAIRRGAVVTLLLEGRGFRIAARGVAAEDGAVGQTIRVVNQASRRELAGRVEDERTVRIQF